MVNRLSEDAGKRKSDEIFEIQFAVGRIALGSKIKFLLLILAKEVYVSKRNISEMKSQKQIIF